MTKLKIKDETALIKIFKTISWLDDMKWNVEANNNYHNYSPIYYYKSDLTNCEKILTHWICYITDRRVSFETVWDKVGYVFSGIVYEYSRNRSTPQQILDGHYRKYEDDRGMFEIRNNKSAHKVGFVSRYVTDDYQNILQTFEVLERPEYKRNIMAYIIDIIRRFGDREDLLLRVACGLHLLTYRLDGKRANSEKITEILNDSEEFEKRLGAFKRTSTRGKNRLWCCIRDYKKGPYHQIFNSAIREVAPEDAEELIRKWESLPMSQIELPDDVWNSSPLFRDNLFADVIDIGSIPETWGMPDIVRDLYNQLKGNEDLSDFYPEQFDVTFDFVPGMCNKKLCYVCPFGKNGVEYTCVPTKDRNCPVAFICCSYIARCAEENCILKEGISKGICRDGLKRVQHIVKTRS